MNAVIIRAEFYEINKNTYRYIDVLYKEESVITLVFHY